MRVAVFSTHAFDRQFLDEANVDRAHNLYYLDARLTAPMSALARGCPAVCAFVNDQLDASVWGQADIITLHTPLTPQTRHIVDVNAIARMQPGVMIVNTGRGALVDARALIAGLKSGRIGYLGLDVYEEEEELFFENLSSYVIQDDVFARLLTFPNVIVTAHQGFFT